MSKWLKLIGINYLVLLALIFSFELTGQLIYRAVRGKWVYERFEKNEDLFVADCYHAVEGRKDIPPNPDWPVRMSMDSRGRRSTFLPADPSSGQNQKPVWCFGGSTTFCTGVHDEDSWPWLLNQYLGNEFRVINYGIPGFSVFESTVQLLENLSYQKPEIVLFYIGWNDIRFYHDTLYRKDISVHGEHLKKILTNPSLKFIDYFFTPLLMSKIKQRFQPPPVYKTPLPATVPDPVADSLYVQKLRTLKALSLVHDFKLVLISQVINEHFYRNTDEKSSTWTPHIDNRSMPVLIREFNQLLSSTELEDNNCLVIDSLLIKHRWEDKDFLDDGHFSAQGNRKFVEITGPQILQFMNP